MLPELIVCKKNAEHFALPYAKAGNIPLLATNSGELLAQKIHQTNGLIWLEWAGKPTRWALQSFPKKRFVVRVHDWEVRTNFVRQINWDVPEKIWFINRQTMADFFGKVKVDKSKCFFLPNAVDPDLFEITPNKSFNKHLVAFGTLFGIRKRFYRAVELLRKVHDIDPQWRLTIKAHANTPKKQANLARAHNAARRLSLGGHVNFITQAVNMAKINQKEDVNHLLSDKDIVLSVSGHEGFHYAIADGMLCGLKPVVYNWEWGRANDFWAPYVHNSLEEMAQAITTTQKIDHQHYRRWCIDRFGAKKLVKKLEQKLSA